MHLNVSVLVFNCNHLKTQIAIVLAASLSWGAHGVGRLAGSAVVSGGECFSAGTPAPGPGFFLLVVAVLPLRGGRCG